jgi:hypothetical protein
LINVKDFNKKKIADFEAWIWGREKCEEMQEKFFLKVESVFMKFLIMRR